MIDVPEMLTKEMRLFYLQHGGLEAAVKVGESEWLFPDGAKFFIDGLSHGKGWPQTDVPSDPITRQHRIVQHRQIMFQKHLELVERRQLEYRSLFKREKILGPNREPVCYMYEGPPPTPDKYVAETERLFDIAKTWKRQYEQEHARLDKMLKPTRSKQEELLEATEKRAQLDRQEACDDRMKKLKL